MEEEPLERPSEGHPGFPCGRSLIYQPSYPGVGDQEVSDGVALTFLLLLQLHCDVSIGHQPIRGPVLGTLLLEGQMREGKGLRMPCVKESGLPHELHAPF